MSLIKYMKLNIVSVDTGFEVLELRSSILPIFS